MTSEKVSMEIVDNYIRLGQTRQAKIKTNGILYRSKESNKFLKM